MTVSIYIYIFFFGVLVIWFKALYIQSKHSTADIYPQCHKITIDRISLFPSKSWSAYYCLLLIIEKGCNKDYVADALLVHFCSVSHSTPTSPSTESQALCMGQIVYHWAIFSLPFTLFNFWDRVWLCCPNLALILLCL